MRWKHRACHGAQTGDRNFAYSAYISRPIIAMFSGSVRNRHMGQGS